MILNLTESSLNRELAGLMAEVLLCYVKSRYRSDLGLNGMLGLELPACGLPGLIVDFWLNKAGEEGRQQN